jgi:exodeoxyribonuclease VII large subunit
MPPDHDEPVIGVSEFVGLLNQTFDYAFPSVTIQGELANMRISKGKWLYFDLKDEHASVKFFGTVFQLPGPLEDGMLLKVRGVPHLHNLYGFSISVQAIQPAGEGSIRRAAELLKLQLTKEGLFDVSRKRPIPYPPTKIGLITSGQSAAYADFMKILAARWSGISIELIDVQVQGDIAAGQIVAAIEQFNARSVPPEVLVLIRGGGSADDLAAFSTEQVTRAIAASRIPTLVAIGHEIDISLAELAADQRASTPSNAAELLVPDKRNVQVVLDETQRHLKLLIGQVVQRHRTALSDEHTLLNVSLNDILKNQKEKLSSQQQLLFAFDPQAILRRGYALVRQGTRSIRSIGDLSQNAIVQVMLSDGSFEAQVNTTTKKKGDRAQ